MVVIVLLLAVIISLSVHKGSNPTEAAVLKSAPQECLAGGSATCWVVSGTPRDGSTQNAVSKFLSTVWNTNGAGNTTVLGIYQLQRCANPQEGSNVVCTLWSTATKGEAQALETQFVDSDLFKDIAATHS